MEPSRETPKNVHRKVSPLASLELTLAGAEEPPREGERHGGPFLGFPGMFRGILVRNGDFFAFGVEGINYTVGCGFLLLAPFSDPFLSLGRVYFLSTKRKVLLSAGSQTTASTGISCNQYNTNGNSTDSLSISLFLFLLC